MALSRWGMHPLSAIVKDGSHLRPSKTVRVTTTEVTTTTLLERARWMTNERDWSFQWCSSSENNPRFWETHILGLCKKSMSPSILTGGRDKWDRRFCGNHSLLICPPISVYDRSSVDNPDGVRKAKKFWMTQGLYEHTCVTCMRVFYGGVSAHNQPVEQLSITGLIIVWNLCVMITVHVQWLYNAFRNKDRRTVSDSEWMIWTSLLWCNLWNNSHRN